MKTFKNIDWILQLAFMIIPFLLYLINAFVGIGNIIIAREMFSFFYIGVGGWQLISVIIHFFFTSEIKHRLRNVYLVLLGITLFIGLLAGITYEQNLLGYLSIMLWWTPLLAMLYLITCIIETKKIQSNAS